LVVKNYYSQLEEVSDSEFVKNYVATIKQFMRFDIRELWDKASRDKKD